MIIDAAIGVSHTYRLGDRCRRRMIGCSAGCWVGSQRSTALAGMIIQV